MNKDVKVMGMKRNAENQTTIMQVFDP